MGSECAHKFGLKKREVTNELYCPVCRATVLKEELDGYLRPGTGWWAQELTETQKHIEDAYFQGYRVTENGRLLSKTGKERPISLGKGQKYPTLSVRVGDKPKRVYGIPLHQFASYCFTRKHPDKGLVVRHLDGNVLNIAKDNIAIGTYSENEQDKPKEVRVRSAKIARAAQG